MATMSQQPILDYFESEEQQLPELYSRKIIIAFTILFSILFGTMLYIYNLKKLNKWQLAILATSIAVFYHYVGIRLLDIDFAYYYSSTLLFNLAGGVLLVGPLWSWQIGHSIVYKKKSPFYPLLLAIAVATIWLYLKQV